MALLFAARVLISFVPLRLWRSSLGEVQASSSKAVAWSSVHAVTRAINRASDLLPIAIVCLPRAIAAQWMLTRRGIAPRLIIGVMPGDTPDTAHALHAWVEVDGRIVIGADKNEKYRARLTLQKQTSLPKA